MPTPLVVRPGVRAVLRVDAGIEVGYVVACLVLGFGLLGTDDWSRPAWLGMPVLLVGAGILVVAAVVLWQMGDSATPAALRAVATANAATAVAAGLWAALGWGARVELRTALGVSAAVLGALAGTQYVVARA